MIREHWKKFAVPGFFGRVVSFFRIELADDGEVRLRIRTEGIRSSSPDVTKIPWTDVGTSDKRDERVQDKLKEVSGEVYVICPVAQLIGDVRDGFIDKTVVVRSEERYL